MLIALPVSGLAQEVRTYGTSAKTVLALSPWDFRPADSTTTYQLNNVGPIFWQTLSRTGGGADQRFKAPLHLPAGALVTDVEFAFCDTSDSAHFEAQFTAIPRASSGLAPTHEPLIDSGDTEMPGCVTRTTMLGPGIEIDNHTNYYELEVFLGTTGTAIQLASARVSYQLQVSPAPAVATFNDVPTTHPFFAFIEALVASGLTGGCSVSPPLFCPDDVVTRKQLAAFFARALGLHFVP
jgi:hypothetical protein